MEYRAVLTPLLSNILGKFSKAFLSTTAYNMWQVLKCVHIFRKISFSEKLSARELSIEFFPLR